MTKRLDPGVKAANKIKFGKIRSERMMGEGNHFFGKHHSEEANEKNRAAHIGKPSSRKGAILSDETKTRIKTARTGNFCKPCSSLASSRYPGSAAISLSNGKFTIVDYEDFERLNTVLWCVSKRHNVFYVHRTLGNGKYETMHHVIMGVPPKGLTIDHVNGDGLDNRRCNLRIVTNRENCLNKHWKKGEKYVRK